MKFKWIYGMKGYFNRYKNFTIQVVDLLRKERKLRNKSILRVRVNLDTTNTSVIHLRREMIAIKDDLKLHDLAKKNLLNYVTRLESVVHDMILINKKIESSIEYIKIYDEQRLDLEKLIRFLKGKELTEELLEKRITRLELSNKYKNNNIDRL